MARMAVLLAGLPTSVPGATVNRLCGSGLEAVIQASRAIARRRRRRLPGRRGRVDEPRAVGAAQARQGASPRGHETLHSTTLGWRMVNPAMPAEWTVAARRERRAAGRPVLDQPRGAGRVRGRVAPAGRARPGTTASTTTRWSLVEGTDLTRDEGIRPDATHGVAGPAQAGVPHRRHGHRGQRLAAERRRRRPVPRRRRPASPAWAARRRWPGSSRRAAAGVDPQRLRHRPGRGRQPGARRAPASAGPTSTSSSSTRRSRRSRWPACAPGPTSTPTIVNVNGGAIAIGHPLGCLAAPASSAPSRTSCTAAAAAGAWPRSASASARAWPSSCTPEEA